MTLLQSILGMTEVQVISADFWTVQQRLGMAEIPVFDIDSVDEMTFRFCVYRKDVPQLKRILEKHGDNFRILRKAGIYWAFHGIAARPILLAGIGMLALLSIVLPTRVLFLQVEGNERISEKQILEAASASGVGFNARRADVRSEQLKNALISNIPEIKWAGVNTAGCTAVISVKERAEATPQEYHGAVCSIVASKDGIIETCTAAKGNLLCSPGQAVKQGQILISGYTDCGLCIRATRAEGEILARTEHDQQTLTLQQFREITSVYGTTKKYSLLIGKKRIKLWNSSRIWEDSCGRIYEENYMVLPGGFCLPIALCCETIVRYDTEFQSDIDAQAQKFLIARAEKYLQNHMTAGSILSQSTIFDVSNGICRLSGHYSCQEMIGSIHWEQIGEINGEDS